jgi:hypothetical protein
MSLYGPIRKKFIPKKWTKEELKQLEELVKSGMKLKDIAKIMGRSASSVRIKANDMGFRQPVTRQKQWSSQEEKRLAAMIKDGLSHQEIADIMGRTYASIKTRASELRLKHPGKVYPFWVDRGVPYDPPKKVGPNLTLIKGEVYKAPAYKLIGGERDGRIVRLIYEGKKGRHYMFRSKVGGWRICYTDAQIMDIKLTQ